VEIPVFNGDLNGKEFIECLSIGERVFDMKYAPIYDTDFDDEDLVEESSLSYGQETDKKNENGIHIKCLIKFPTWKITCNSILLVSISQHFLIKLHRE
jgi:hypothetical protein